MENALSSTQLQHPTTLHLSEKYLHIKEAWRRKMSFILLPWGKCGTETVWSTSQKAR